MQLLVRRKNQPRHLTVTDVRFGSLHMATPIQDLQILPAPAPSPQCPAVKSHTADHTADQVLRIRQARVKALADWSLDRKARAMLALERATESDCCLLLREESEEMFAALLAALTRRLWPGVDVALISDVCIPADIPPSSTDSHA